MNDISDTVRRAVNQAGWTSNSAIAVASSLATALDSAVDWDDDEEWVSVLTGHIRTVMIYIRRPIAVLTDEAAQKASMVDLSNIPMIRVDSFDDQALACDLDILTEVFSDLVLSQIDAHRFSANDLWFATV